MTEQAMRACAPDEPVMVAWNAYKATDDYRNSLKWCGAGHAEGSLWACFLAGFKTAIERAAMLHEDINPASDDERLHKVPGAGGMGAVIQYRDEIRQLLK
jgi:hypothetical protein